MEEYLKEIIIDKGCPLCHGKLKYIGYNKFSCTGNCKSNFKQKIKQKVNPNDTSKWKSTCLECGGKMDYYNFKYCCRKCGNILEV